MNLQEEISGKNILFQKNRKKSNLWLHIIYDINMNTKFAYQSGLPLIPIVIKGRTGEISLNTLIDFAASKTLVPQESPVKSILGRDVLDHFKVCLNGKKERGNNFFRCIK